jgi:hypothetical protein
MAFPYNLLSGLQPPQPNYPIDRRDLLDYQGSNSIQSARYIDPITKDFVVSSTNHFEGMNAVEQSVMLAINTTFNTSAQRGLGQNFLSPKFVSNQIQTQMEALLQSCLAYQIQNNQITLLNVQIMDNGFGQIAIQFAYTNNTLGTTAAVSFILP